MPDHNRLCLRSTKDDARLSRLLIAHANSGTLEEPAEAATRSRGKAAQMFAIRRAFHLADKESTNARLQCMRSRATIRNETTGAPGGT